MTEQILIELLQHHEADSLIFQIINIYYYLYNVLIKQTWDRFDLPQIWRETGNSLSFFHIKSLFLFVFKRMWCSDAADHVTADLSETTDSSSDWRCFLSDWACSLPPSGHLTRLQQTTRRLSVSLPTWRYVIYIWPVTHLYQMIRFEQKSACVPSDRLVTKSVQNFLTLERDNPDL